MHGIYFILTVKDPKRALYLVEEVASTGVCAIQLRAKEGIEVALAHKMHTICQQHSVPFIVNDSVDLALKIDAEGLHLGQTDFPLPQARHLLGPDKILGATAPLPSQIKKASSEGANYVGVGHVFPTQTKNKTTPPIGYEGIKQAAKIATIPIVAIGGLTCDTLEAIHAAGARCAAICASIAYAPNPKQAAHLLVNQWKSITNKSS